MNKIINKFIESMDLKPPTTEEHLKVFEKEIGIDLPFDYKEFMLSSNGAGGFIGDSYLLIWSIEETLEINKTNVNDRTLCLSNESQPVVCFGSDGGDMAYAFDKRTKETSIITFPLISIISEEYESCGNTFNEFLQNLNNEK